MPHHVFLAVSLDCAAFREVKTIQDVDKLRVLSGKQELELLWKDDFTQQPVFPAFEFRDGIWELTSRPQVQAGIRSYMRNACQAAHWNIGNATLYIIRRGVGTALNREFLHYPLLKQS